uniref:Uncharacterized protein n=1 Tax=Vespula pensylvanica TaxID=30213 RepID=A0A834KA01_VESPE|nr:hypothetical protein H0235_015438 [Vespula pensylvanica]
MALVGRDKTVTGVEGSDGGGDSVSRGGGGDDGDGGYGGGDGDCGGSGGGGYRAKGKTSAHVVDSTRKWKEDVENKRGGAFSNVKPDLDCTYYAPDLCKVQHPSAVDEKQRSQTSVNRGRTKFDINKSLDNYETTIGPSGSRSRLDRDRNTETRVSRLSNNKKNDKTLSRNANVVKESSFGSRDRERTAITERTINPDKTSNLFEKKEETTIRRNERRYLPEKDEKKIGRRIDQETTLESPTTTMTTMMTTRSRSRSRKENNNASRRVSSRGGGSIRKVNAQYLEVNTGPSVFSGTTENSRSRTGRKINPNYNNEKESRKKLSSINRRYNTDVSRNNTSRRNGANSRGSSRKDTDLSKRTTEKSMHLTESESVRVDIPLTLATTDYPKLTTVNNNNVDPIDDRPTSSRSSSRNIERRNDDRDYVRSNINESRNLDRTKTRRTSTNTEDSYYSTTQRSTINQRRGSSKFVDFAVSDTPIDISTIPAKKNDRNDVRRRSTDRTRNFDRKTSAKDFAINESSNSRSRGRSLDIVSRSVPSGSSILQTDVKRRSSVDNRSNNKNPEIRSRSIDNIQDQDNRGRLKGRIRNESTTTKFIDPSIETTTSMSDQSTNLPISDTTITTMRTTGQRTITDDPSSSRVRSRTRNVSQARNNTREDYFNYGLGFRGRKFPTSDDMITTSTFKPSRLSSASQTNRGGNPGWTLFRRRPDVSSISTTEKERINEIAMNDDRTINNESITATRNRGSKKSMIDDPTTSTVSTTTTKNFNSKRRGNKNQFDKNTTNMDKVSDSEESDNYPPDFKARLSQLKNSNLKIPVVKSTPRTSTEAFTKYKQNITLAILDKCTRNNNTITTTINNNNNNNNNTNTDINNDNNKK